MKVADGGAQPSGLSERLTPQMAKSRKSNAVLFGMLTVCARFEFNYLRLSRMKPPIYLPKHLFSAVIIRSQSQRLRQAMASSV